MDLVPVLIAVDEDIRAGRLVRARAQLRELLKKSLARDVALRAAGLARRCGMPEQSLRLLAPTVRPSARSLVVASPDEIIEYAGALVAIGAHREALDLLASVPVARASEAALQRAFAHFAQWNYAAAIDCLQVYLRSDRIDAYRRLVGEVNLAAALVHERKDQPAQALLRRLLVQTEAPGFARLHANVLELAAQAAIERAAWTEAADYLERAQALLRGQGVRDAFYIEKWRAVLDLRRHPKSSPA
ncbi:MAG: hypothetical protein JST16_14695, partial [Bdellovibrionales bacterium]|nr:hypothetical protein [Bdellovibrionales bacterium]